jgi:hypothetical protein
MDSDASLRSAHRLSNGRHRGVTESALVHGIGADAPRHKLGRLGGASETYSRLTSIRANPTQGGDAKPRGCISQPGYR